MSSKIALITGANRGMGLATTEKLAKMGIHVIMVGRNEQSLKEKSSQLQKQKLSVEYFIADMEIKNDLYQLIEFVEKKYQKIDILINNAGIFKEEKNFLELSEENFEKTFNINTKAPYILIKGFLPLMKKNKYGRIVNVSSGLGSYQDASPNYLSYSLSKNALNMLTHIFSQEINADEIKINSICPGWVRTDMGGKMAPRSIEEGIEGILWAATLDSSGPNGKFFYDQKEMNW